MILGHNVCETCLISPVMHETRHGIKHNCKSGPRMTWPVLQNMPFQGDITVLYFVVVTVLLYIYFVNQIDRHDIAGLDVCPH